MFRYDVVWRGMARDGRGIWIMINMIGRIGARKVNFFGAEKGSK